MNATQRTTEKFVIALTVLVSLGVVGMFLDSAAVMFVTEPLVVAVLLYLSLVDAPGGAGKRAGLIAIHVFNAVHTAVWLGMLALLPVAEASFWGLPPSTGLMIYVLWPISVVAVSLLYAYVSKRTGVVDRVADAEAAPDPAMGRGSA